MKKSPEAFRTISEVADWLGVPTHVLRFWESRFSQVKPVKRAGGRRYYRPSDMLLIGGIKRLLHDDGMTIRAVQKMLREEGVKHVSGFSQSIDDVPMNDVTPATEVADDYESPIALDVPEEPVDNVVPLQAEPQAAPTDDGAPDADAREEPSFAFLSRRATSTEGKDAASDRQADLFSSSRDSEADTVAEAAAPTIPPTPDVPETDPADDAPAHRKGPGPIARLVASRPMDRRLPAAEIERAVAALRSLRRSA